MAQLICETVVYGGRGRRKDPDAIMHGPGLIPPDVDWDTVERELKRRFPDDTSVQTDDEPSDHECDWAHAAFEWRGDHVPTPGDLMFA